MTVRSLAVGMSVRDSEPEVPPWVAVAILALVGLGGLYVVLVGGHAFGAVVWLLWLLGLALSLFVVYLFWRFVLAVERIADKL
jgi:hypothetical protein